MEIFLRRPRHGRARRPRALIVGGGIAGLAGPPRDVLDQITMAQELASHESDGQPDPVGTALGRYAARLPRVRHVQEATAMRTSLASLPLAQRLGVMPAWEEISVRSFAPLVPDP